MVAVPSVGRVILDKIRNNVLLPAPFCPKTPNTSPRLTEKETLRSAQRVSVLFDSLPGLRMKSNGETSDSIKTLPKV